MTFACLKYGMVALLFAGCALSPGAARLNTMQDDITYCITMGGIPELGPDQTVVCRR